MNKTVCAIALVGAVATIGPTATEKQRAESERVAQEAEDKIMKACMTAELTVGGNLHSDESAGHGGNGSDEEGEAKNLKRKELERRPEAQEDFSS